MEEQQKEKQVRAALKGLDVSYLNHRATIGTLHNMARVNGYSIIWHEGAFCWGEPDTVEVRIPGGDIHGHYPIAKLRDLVTGVITPEAEEM